MAKLQFRVLYREFLFRMVDLEVLSAHAQGDTSRLLGQFASLLIFLSLLLSIAGFGCAGARTRRCRFAYTLSSEHFLIATTMLVVGLFAVLSWDSTFPDRRDVLVLAPLPVRARTMFLAKVAAVATALGLTVVVLHGARASSGRWPSRRRPLRNHSVIHLRYHAGAGGGSGPGPRDATRLAPGASGRQMAPGTGGGVAIGVWKQGASRVFAFGAAKPDSLFEIGSITKTFTGRMLAQMVAQGKVRMNEPIRELLPPGLVTKPAGV